MITHLKMLKTFPCVILFDYQPESYCAKTASMQQTHTPICQTTGAVFAATPVVLSRAVPDEVDRALVVAFLDLSRKRAIDDHVVYQHERQTDARDDGHAQKGQFT